MVWGEKKTLIKTALWFTQVKKTLPLVAASLTRSLRSCNLLGGQTRQALAQPEALGFMGELRLFLFLLFSLFGETKRSSEAETPRISRVSETRRVKVGGALGYGK